jgi:hypothetical protein
VFGEPGYAGTKVDCVTKDKSFRDVGSRCDSEWNKPGKIEESVARDRVAEELREVTNVGVVNWEVLVDITTGMETSEAVTRSKEPPLGSVALTATQGTEDGGRWRSRPISL